MQKQERKTYILTRPGYMYEVDNSVLLLKFLEELLNIEIKYSCKHGMLNFNLISPENIFTHLKEVLFDPLLSGGYKFLVQKSLDVNHEKDENLHSR